MEKVDKLSVMLQHLQEMRATFNRVFKSFPPSNPSRETFKKLMLVQLDSIQERVNDLRQEVEAL